MARLRAGAQRHAHSAGFAARPSRAVRAARKWRTAARSERPPPPPPTPLCHQKRGRLCMKVKFGPVGWGQGQTGANWVGIAWGGVGPPSSDVCAHGPEDGTVFMGLLRMVAHLHMRSCQESPTCTLSPSVCSSHPPGVTRESGFTRSLRT